MKPRHLLCLSPLLAGRVAWAHTPAPASDELLAVLVHPLDDLHHLLSAHAPAWVCALLLVGGMIALPGLRRGLGRLRKRHPVVATTVGRYGNAAR